MLDLKTLVDIRRVLTDYLTAWHTDEGFEEILELTKKVNSAIIEARKNEKTSDAPKEIYSNKESYSNMDRFCTDNYNLLTKDKNGDAHIYRADSLKNLLLTLENNREMLEQSRKNFVVKEKEGKTTKFVANSVSALIDDIKNYINTYLPQGE